MKRRNFIATLGLATTSGATLLGTGAFTSVQAERSISVAVADDAYAYLRLNERGKGERSETDGGTLEFSIPGDDEGEYPTGNPTDPDGLGTDSVYRFGADAAHDESGLFAVRNRGTQPVEVYSTQGSTEGVPSVTMFDVDSGDLLTESSPSAPLGVGAGPLVCGLEIDTHGVPIQDEAYDVDLTINAVATDGD
ncbi:hypothetical protein [Halobacterium rubrum]|uniref:hypothetical protein n=1 Tax=Halobacterium TaxID=2239 RepID=UPI001F172244|nr:MULTISPECIES: hypothetical protein [Halobacterium]MDH5018895.1 hypothetical protein [Halobacterium rubrum]